MHSWTRLALLTLLAAAPALARDTVLKIKLEDVLAMPEAKGRLNGEVKFYLAGSETPKITETFEESVSNKKTNGVGKSDEVACKWVALSTLMDLQETAKRRGANAVVDLVSFYKKAEFKSPTELECHAGSIVVAMALKGKFAKVAAAKP